MTTDERKPKASTREFDRRLAVNMAALHGTADIPPASATLAADLLAVVVARRAKHLREDEAVLGAMAAALLTALACAMPRTEFVAWLRRTAGILAAPQPRTRRLQPQERKTP